MTTALVLFSGGLDSTAALLWALHREDSDVHALFIDYGQPAGQREIERAIAATRQLSVQFHRCDLRSAFGGIASGLFSPSRSSNVDGVDTAFVPARNLVLLSAGLCRGLNLLPAIGDSLRLIVGFNRDDVSGFPDCSTKFVAAFELAANLGLGRTGAVQVEAPWTASSKAEVVQWARDNAAKWMPLIEASWSCYRERGPCGECTACVLRAKAL